MSSKAEKPKTIKAHHDFAVACFNKTWDLMEKQDRTPEETDLMIHSAHASRFHWTKVVNADKEGKFGPENLERGDWQISRMYTVLKRYEPAIFHAKRCLQICKEHTIKDWDIAFAYEALARAYALNPEKRKEAKQNLKLAEQAGEEIRDQNDKDYLLGELKTIEIPE